MEQFKKLLHTHYFWIRNHYCDFDKTFLINVSQEVLKTIMLVSRMRFFSSLIIVLLLLYWLVGLAAARPPLQEPVAGETAGYDTGEEVVTASSETVNARVISAMAENVSNFFPVQGMLTDKVTGLPIDGNRTIRFALYNSATGGSPLCQSNTQVTVTEGFFEAVLDGCDVEDFNGEERYLGIKVGSDEEMTPRQPLLPVPFAFTLVPGANVQGRFDSRSMLFVGNSGIVAQGDTNPVTAVFGYSSTEGRAGTTYGVQGRSESQQGRGVYGFASATQGDTFGVLGFNRSTTGRGAGGVADTTTGTAYGLYGENRSNAGYGVYGVSINAITGTTYGVYGTSKSPLGTGVYGTADAITGTTYGVFGTTKSPTGYGVYGEAEDATATNYGVYGKTNSPIGYGVYGVAEAVAGINYGVQGTSKSVDGRGVYGLAEGIQGRNYGVYGETLSPGGRGVYGSASATTGDAYGVYGFTESPEGQGVRGVANAATGVNYGVAGRSRSIDGTGVFGLADAITGTTYGLLGQSDSDSGYGGYGRATYTGTGVTYGLYGESAAQSGRGVYGHATALTGTTYGVYGKSDSPVGIAVRAEHSGSGVGLLAQSAAGNPIEAYGIGAEKVFRVENNGDVYAQGSYNCGGVISETVTTITDTMVLTDGTTVITSVTRSDLAPCLQDSSEADFAEMLPTSQDTLEPGDVLVINNEGELVRSGEAYQPTVVGVYSTKPSYLGNSQMWGQSGFAPLALVGIVPVKASTENGAIQPGDMLVASDTPGHAMRAGTDAPNGTVIGKALANLEADTGLIRMLVMLQ